MRIRARPWEANGGSVAARVELKHGWDMVGVRVGVFECTPGNRVLESTLVGLSPCACVDLKGCPCWKVCPVFHTRVQVFF